MRSLIQRIEDLKLVLETHWKARILGASLFFVAGDGKAKVNLIDMGHMEVLEEGKWDEGFLKGLAGVLAILNEL